MTIQDFQRVHRQRPFKKFRINMADGRSVPVDHPEFTMQHRNGRLVYVVLHNGDMERIDLLLVTSIAQEEGEMVDDPPPLPPEPELSPTE